MDSIEFSKQLTPEMICTIFKNYFEQHIAAYYMLRGLNFVSMNISDVDKASITYSVKLLNPEQIDRIINNLRHGSAILKIRNINVKPTIQLNGDLLCITLYKDNINDKKNKNKKIR